MIAPPLFFATALIQACTRHGFSLTRNAVSLLDLGNLGWIQRTNFVVTGLLLAAGALGLKQALTDGPGHRWVPRLLSIAAVGTALAGLFAPDPSDGYPPGTPPHLNSISSAHGAMHMIVSSAAFLACAAICVIVGKRAARPRHNRLRIASYLVAVISTICIVTAGGPKGALTMFVGISLSLLWIAGTCLRTLHSVPAQSIATAAG